MNGGATTTGGEAEHPLRRERDDRGAGVHGVGGDAPVPAAQGAVRAEREAPRRPLHRQIHPQPLPPKPARPVLAKLALAVLYVNNDGFHPPLLGLILSVNTSSTRPSGWMITLQG